MRRLLCCLLACCFVLFACSEEVTGPEPQMGGGPDDLTTDPSFVCNEDPGTWITLHGDDFSPLVIDSIAAEEDHDVELPTVTLTLRTDPTGEDLDQDFRITLDSPPGADGGDIRWIDDETLRFRVDADLELIPGVYDIEVDNPNGSNVTEHEAVGVLPRPTLEAIIPELTCVAQGERAITLEGSDFLIEGDDEYPTVSIDDQRYQVSDVDGCHGLHDVFGDHQLCSEASATVDEDSLTAGTHDVVFENIAPADCPSNPQEDGVTLTIEDPPQVHDIQPSPVCSEQIDYETVQIDGEGFVVMDGDSYPTVSIGDQTYEPSGADGCETISEPPTAEAQRCTELTVSIAAEDLAGEVDDEQLVTELDVVVENPEPVGCHSIEDTTLGVVPPPTLTSVEPRATCNNDGSVTFNAQGDHLFEVDGLSPHVVIDGTDYDAHGIDCQDVDGQEGVRTCDSLDVDVTDPSDLDGAYSMVAVNPEPISCQSPPSEEFYAAGPPVISDADPDGFCEDETFDGQLELLGQFLYDPEGELPTVSVDGEPVDFDLSGCSQTIDDFSLELCGGISTTIPEDMIDDEFDVTVTASDPLACGSDTISLERTTPPTIDSVIPTRVCADGGTTLTVNGQDLHEDADFVLNGVSADDDDVTVSADGTTATVTFEPSIPGDWATFEVINPGDCGSVYEEELRVTDGPLPIFVDPPVVFDEMNTRVTIYAAGLYGGTIDEVELVHPDGETTVLNHDYDDSRPQVVQATIPEFVLDEIDDDDFNDGTNAADFGIRLTDHEITCSNESEELVTITSDLTVAVEDIDPPFGGQDQSTGVEITAAEDPDDGEVQFQAVPRAYLNPVDDSVGTLGREIRAMQFIDETELNGVVPSGLSTGFYDLIVVNPDGSVGVLDDAFQITEERPPLVDSVSPASWPTGEAALAVDIDGENFRDDPENPDVEVFCQPSGSDETDEDLLDQPNEINILDVTDSTIEITVDTDNLEALSACYMRVTNADGTYAEYSPITTTNPAEKFLEFQAGNDFETPRRAPTALSGAPTRAARYLYVIGGDDGTTDEALSSGEFARLDRFGAPGSWAPLPYDLPSGRSMADGLRIDDFVYLVGGSDEGDTTDEVLRAQVLDPLDVPEIVDVDIDVEQLLEGDPDDVDGLEAGTYYYRVSAVYTDDDPANPGGESLASEPQPIQLPVDGVTLTISWNPPTDINHDIDYYAVYRNVDPDDAYGDESLIATVDAGDNSYTDDGSDTPADGDNPLAQGSLGTWHQVATLNHAREQAGITFAPSPTVDDEYFIYAVGGQSDDGSSRDDYEFISVEVDGFRDQWVGDATIGLDGADEMLMPSPRTGLTAAVAYESNASAVADVSPQIFVYGGESDTTSDTNIKVTTVGDDGHLESWTTFGPNQRMSGGGRIGHAGAVLNNNLVYAGGGGGGAPGDDGFHTDVLCDTDGGCPPATIPSDFSNLSDLNMEPRAWMGDIPFRGFWYFTGGVDAAGPTTTIQYSVAGATP